MSSAGTKPQGLTLLHLAQLAVLPDDPPDLYCAAKWLSCNIFVQGDLFTLSSCPLLLRFKNV